MAVPVKVSAPVLSGTAQIGQVVSTSTGTWTNSPTSYAYTYYITDDPTLSAMTAIQIIAQGATATFTVPTTFNDLFTSTTKSTVGYYVVCSVVATNASGSSSGSLSNNIGTITAAASVATGTLNVTDAADTLSATGKVIVSGSLAVTDGADALVATGSVRVKGALGVTEGMDTLAASGSARVTGALAVTDAADTLTATAKLIASGSLSVTDDVDTISAPGVVITLPVTFIGTSVFPSSTGSFTITKPAGTAAGDLMMVFCPYGGTVTSPGGAWLSDTRTWTYGYDIHVYARFLSAADISGSISISGVSYAPVTAIVYRGPTSIVEMGYAESAGGDSTLAIARTARSNSSLGQVTWISDRSGDGSPAPPTGFTLRTGPNATGVFTASIADRIDGTQPSASGSDTWTSVSTTSSYTQVGFNFEFLNVVSTGTLSVGDDIDTLAASGAVRVTGTLATSDANDSLAAAGTTLVRGSLTVTEEADTLSSAGFVRETVRIGTVNVTEDPDTLTAFGSLFGGPPISGAMASTEPTDILQATGVIRETTWGARALITEEDDLLTGFGTVVVTGFATANDEGDIPFTLGIVAGWLKLDPNDETWTPQSASSEDWTPQDPANEAWTPQQPAEEDWLPQSANSKDWRS